MELDNKTLFENFSNILKKNGIKMTPQRSIIYGALLDSRDHPYADIIFKKARESFPNISYDTVNRTLLTFAKIGIIDLVEGYGEPKRFDINTNKHHHFRCINCSKIVDFQNSSFDGLVIPEEISRKYNVIKARVVLEGTCDECK